MNFAYLVVSKKDPKKVFAGANTLYEAESIANLFGSSIVTENVLLRVRGKAMINRDHVWIELERLTDLLLNQLGYNETDKKVSHELGEVEIIVKVIPAPEPDPNEPDF